jgi:hypothetical protein
MSYDKPIQRIATGGGLLSGLSAIAVAQTPAPRSDTRSYEMGTLLEGAAYMIGKDMRLHGSNVRVTAVQHETPLKKGPTSCGPDS